MLKIKKREYIKYSRTIIRKLYVARCFGKGSIYKENILNGLPDKEIANKVLEALVKQKIIQKKKKKHGWKYYLNMNRIDKIKQIIKEKGRISLISLLLSLKNLN